MARYIDADKLAKDLDENVLNDPNCPMFIATTVDQYIGTAPTADVHEVRHASWTHDDEGNAICTGCKGRSSEIFAIYYNFCPDCGAIMDGKEEQYETD